MDYRRKIIASSPHLSHADGAVASFADGTDLPLKSLIVDIDPVQSGTGDPSPSNIRPISGWDAVGVHNGNTVVTTISLGRTVYGGTLNVLTGELVIDRYWWELNTVATQWTKSSSYPGGFYTPGGNYKWNGQQAKTNTPFICSHAKTATTLSEYGANRNVCYMDGSINIRIMSDSATKQDWVDYLTEQKNAGTPVQICCYLMNPVAYTLDPHTVRSLAGQNNIFADTGNLALDYWAHP